MLNIYAHSNCDLTLILILTSNSFQGFKNMPTSIATQTHTHKNTHPRVLTSQCQLFNGTFTCVCHLEAKMFENFGLGF